MGTEDLLSLQGLEESHDETNVSPTETPQEDLLSLQGEVAFPVETGCFPYEDGLLYTGKAEAIKETPKEELMEATNEDEESQEKEGVFPFDPKLITFSYFLPLDELQPSSLISKPARDEHKEMPSYTGQEWMEKAQDRQAQINAEILAEFAR